MKRFKYKFQEICYIPGTFHCNVTKDLRKVVKWIRDHFHLSNLKTVFANVVRGMTGSSKAAGAILFQESP